MPTINSWNTPDLTLNGQLLIGNTGNRPSASTLTAGAGISITNAGGSITVSQDGDVTNANIIYVGKHGNDAWDGRNVNTAKLTIQAAVTLAVDGDTILVYPGVYTETITHAANNVSVFAIGDSTNCIIQQTDANVINFNSQIGIVYKFFRIQATVVTTAIDVIQGTTGTATFTDCFLRCVCAANIVAATQPSIVSLTGAGSVYISLGSIDYLHTGNCGVGALKSALLVGTGGLIELRRNSAVNVTCSGSALATALAIDLAATGNINIYTSTITVSDPDALIVAGLGYLGGVGTEHEYFLNVLHVMGGAANSAYGFFAGDTASVSRFFYNHIHVEDTGGSSYSFYVGATANVISHFDDIVAEDGALVDPAGIFTTVNSPIDGNLTLTSPKAAGTELLTIANTDNTATASSASLKISVGGATSTGDPYINFLVTGAGTFSAGIDNSASDVWRLTTGATPSAGINILGALGTQFDIFPTNNTVTPTVNIAAGSMDNQVANTMVVNIASGTQAGGATFTSTKTINIGGSNTNSNSAKTQTLNLCASTLSNFLGAQIINMGTGNTDGCAQFDINIGNGTVAYIGAISKNILIGSSAFTDTASQNLSFGYGAVSGDGIHKATLQINIGTESMSGTASHTETINIGTGTLNATNSIKTINVGTGTNTLGTRNVNIGQIGTAVTIDANARFGTASNSYRSLSFGGGNSFGYIYGNFPTFTDGMQIGYNYYVDDANVAHIYNAAGGTSRLNFMFEGFTFAAGPVNTAPADVATLNYQGFALTGLYYFSHEFARIGGDVFNTVRNTDNTNAASSAFTEMSVGGASAGDVYFNFIVTTVTMFSLGIDNSDSDKLKITSGATPSAASTLWQMTTAGERTMPLQPSFFAYVTGDAEDVTGDGTDYTIVASSEIWDQNNDFDGTSTFTAPVTGKYFFKFSVYLEDLTTSNTIYLVLSTSNRTYGHYYSTATPGGGGTQVIGSYYYADMDAADTAYCYVDVSGGTKIVDVIHGSGTSFSGELSV
jgi:hypothetical protein